MAKLHTHVILYTISLLAIFFSCTHARTNIISMPGSGSSNPTTQEWLRAFKVQEGETLTELHLFIQDNTSGPKKTVYNVAESPVTSTSPTYFGRTQVVDHQITTGPGSDSPQVGRLQGIHLLADLHQVALTVNWNIIFTDGPYKGSTLTVLGRLPSLETEGELSIVSGTGTFLLARGIVLKKTYAIDPATYNMVLEFRLFVTTPKL